MDECASDQYSSDQYAGDQYSYQIDILLLIGIMSYRLESIEKSLVPKGKTRLQEIRQRIKLDQQELRGVLFSPNNYEKYLIPLYQHFENNRQIYSHADSEDHNLKEMRRQAVKMILAVNKLMKVDNQKDPLQLMYALYGCNSFESGISTKGNLQNMLYTKSILLYQNHPIHQEFFEKAKKLQHIGCFGLTQFHHGSYSKGIQTLAEYHHQTKTFSITTQGTKGMKFWIGAAAEVANMAVIWAQLIVNGQSKGPHPFLVQLRCFKTHKVLPGVTVGDCGPKNGMNYIDNGYIILDNIVVPKHNLLGKLGDVNDEGNYVSPVVNEGTRFGLHMSALSGGRALISFSLNALPVATLTIALRYACMRKQFENPSKTDENLIIDYPLTKMRLLPWAASTMLQLISGKDICFLYLKDSKWMMDFIYVAELHAISASLKARTTWNCLTSVAECRSIMGGHGYSTLSRMASIFHSCDVNTTWQGDNHMLLQQTSKYLMKILAKKEKTQIIDLSFVHVESGVDHGKIMQNIRILENLRLMIEDIFRIKYENAKQKIQELSKKYTNKEEIWYYFHSEAGNSLSLSYADLYIFNRSMNSIATMKHPATKQYLINCLYLWGFNLLEKERYGSFELRQVLQKEVLSLCDQITDPTIVALDMISPSKFVIGSPFADFEGDGFKEYLHILYTAKDTFKRIDYYEDLIKAKAEIQ